MLARPGGPKLNEEIYNIFVILWAIYNSKRTKTPEDIEQINLFYVRKSRFLSPVLSHRRTHSTDTHSRIHAETRI